MGSPGTTRMPQVIMSLVFVCLVLVVWSSYNLQLQSKAGWWPGLDDRNASIREAWIQKWLTESEAIWKKGIAARSEAERKTMPNPNKPWGTTDYRNIWDYFYPTFNCPHTVERLGRLGDGGKWVCGISHYAEKNYPCVVFSYGISGDSSFEEDVLNRTNCFVYAYDHTVTPDKVRLTELYPSRSIFSQLGLGTGDTTNLRTLKTEMVRHEKDFIDILKIDVEGAEYAAIPQILKDFSDQLPVGQLLIEIHLDTFPQYDLYGVLKTWWTALETAGFRPFRAEPNLIAQLVLNRSRPTFYEISFLNVRFDHLLLHS